MCWFFLTWLVLIPNQVLHLVWCSVCASIQFLRVDTQNWYYFGIPFIKPFCSATAFMRRLRARRVWLAQKLQIFWFKKIMATSKWLFLCTQPMERGVSLGLWDANQIPQQFPFWNNILSNLYYITNLWELHKLCNKITL